ncbi:conserved protein of unknown function [Petrocella atlantisensis]|uniref:Uncharacterized protein n=1 Tax=Petrocella atlantisensis TaxID=2173034 RepID=A0A3P7Q017_9FIRM|nr:hypothetical protein [Petrocella atlantisensis]MCF8019675.1 hypothetical protein [Vallitaleaceae bacterium]PKM54572.1 MAG: hypothetical protein CVV00_07575 [Firmicutes bacterium HGW-Firmicutes-5]VDN48751.1 conserved protein of unknown function [Petrocella atlantisensis]
MDKRLELLRKKSRIVYDMNCIKKYIEMGDFDASLEKAWDKYQLSLDKVDSELKLLSNPSTKELEDLKMERLAKIKEYERHIELIKEQLEEIDEELKVLSQ